MKRFLLIWSLAISMLALQAQCPDLSDNINPCQLPVTLDAAPLRVFLCGDSLEIIYDATQGQTQLVGAAKVYMHSAAELVPFGGWQYTTGNWGQDDGVGLMTNIGPNLWRIRIHPKTYYNYPGCTINGIFMVFRNEDGTLTGKDSNGNDIFLDLTVNPPQSAFSGVTAQWLMNPGVQYQWSTGDTSAAITVTTPGVYSVTLSDQHGCTHADTVTIGAASTPALGNDTVICAPAIQLTLDAGSGYTSYQWITQATTQAITATAPGLYSVTVTDANGCTAVDDIFIARSTVSGFSLGNDTVVPPGTPVTIDASVFLQTAGDSLIITYNASMGQSQLGGASKVYMHSAAELVPFGGWQYTTGNWGQDDGIGLMQNIGPDLWQITIHPQAYYRYPPGSSLNGIFMVFRNEDGTLTGKDDNGNDIFVDMSGSQPVSAFAGVNAVYTANRFTYQWSTGATTPAITAQNPGTYSVTVTGTYGCSATDDITVRYDTTVTLTVDLGRDTVICSTPFSVVLDAGSGFFSYLWSTGATTRSITVNQYGSYWVTVSDSLGNTASDTVRILSVAHEIDLGDDTTVCGFGGLLLDPGIRITPVDDSLVITYDATRGQTQLIGATKVYMHSGAELHPFGGWQYTVGNWGMDDGIGLMKNIGPDLWQITIHPQTYYGYPPDSTIHGIFMVFRNADGTLTGKDDNGNDIYLALYTPRPSSAFSGVKGRWLRSPFVSVQWSTGASTPALPVSAPGMYWLSATDTNGCTVSDTITVNLGNLPFVDIGNDTAICAGEVVTLSAGSGFTAYQWSTGETTERITVSQTGQYSVTVTDNNGCQGFDVVQVFVSDSTAVDFAFQVNGLEVTFTDMSTGAVFYLWDFDGNGEIDDSTGGTHSFTYPHPGLYNATLIVENGCGRDTIIRLVLIDPTGITGFDTQQTIRIFPNPASAVAYLLPDESARFSPLDLRIFSSGGRMVYADYIQHPDGRLSIPLDGLPSGYYYLKCISGKKIITLPLIVHH